MCPLLLEPPSPPNTPAPSQSTGLSSLCDTEASHQLSVLHAVVFYVRATVSIRPTLSISRGVHKSVLYVCISIQGQCFFYKLLLKRSVSVTAQESRWAQQLVSAEFGHICAVTSALGRHPCSSWVFAHICPSVG